MSNPWPAVVGPLLGVFLGGGLTFLGTWYAQRREDSRTLARSRADRREEHRELIGAVSGAHIVAHLAYGEWENVRSNQNVAGSGLEASILEKQAQRAEGPAADALAALAMRCALVRIEIPELTEVVDELYESIPFPLGADRLRNLQAEEAVVVNTARMLALRKFETAARDLLSA